MTCEVHGWPGHRQRRPHHPGARPRGLAGRHYALLDFLGGHRRVAIDGAAGSGKTLLALAQCRRLARQGYRVLCIFYDENQRIYGTAASGTYPIPRPHHALPHNCRTTRHIHDAALAFHHGAQRPTCRGPLGRPIAELPAGGDDPLGALRAALHELTANEGIPLDQIVVLSTRGPKTSALAEGAKVGNATLTWGEAGRQQLRVRSVHAFKGLESPVVILAEPERAHAANRDALLYVALSRAQHHVIVLGALPRGAS